MTWMLCLALAVGALVNIQLVLTSQQEAMSWQEKYVLAIGAAWPLYIAVGLAVLAAMGAIMDLDSQIASRPEKKEEKPQKTHSPRENYKREQDSFISSISASTRYRENDAEADKVVDLYPLKEDEEEASESTPSHTPSQKAQASLERKPVERKGESEDDDLQFFRMS